MKPLDALRHPLVALDLDFLVRHPVATAKDPRRAWATRKAMKAYRLDHPICEWDGKTSPVEVHHVEPIHVRPDLAADPSNFRSLGARRNHLVIGHAGNWKKWIRNLHHLIRLRQIGPA